MNAVSIASECEYHGEKAIRLQFGIYEAKVIPAIGANLIAFTNIQHGYSYLHEPTSEEFESFRASPVLHGIPILMPPNRYQDGMLNWNGHVYNMPVNEPERHNHLHGVVYRTPWQVADYGSNEQESFVSLQLKVDEHHDIYSYYPFTYTLTVRYSLSSDGLTQQLRLTNDGTESMPCLLGLHTSINAPFAPGSSAKDYRVKLTIGKRWEMTDRMLPTGKQLSLSEDEVCLRDTGINPFFTALDNHYTAVSQDGSNRMELTDIRLGVTLVYEVDSEYKQWMIYNNDATEGFFCPEPQVNLVNAPNMNLSADEMGLVCLAPGEQWQATSRLYEQ